MRSILKVLLPTTAILAASTLVWPLLPASAEEPKISADLQPIRPDDPRLGPASARFTMVVWSDIQCPFCARLFPQLVERVEASKDLNLYYKHYPLHVDCNPDVMSSYHEHACRTAILTSCAGALGRFYEFAPSLFAEPGLDGGPLKKAIRKAGIDLKAFSSCIEGGNPEQDIRLDVEDARGVQLTGTPTLIIRDQQARGPWEQIRGIEALDGWLAERRGGR